MIKFANAKDEKYLKNIWLMSFNDSDKYINSYYENRNEVSKTIVVENNNEIASMADIMDIDVKIDKSKEKAIYIYACATLPKYRKNGFMHDLLMFISDYATKNNYKYLCLIPQNNELFNFYKKQGFNQTVYIDKLEFEIYNKNNINLENIKQINDIDEFVYLKQKYENTFKNSFLHSKKFIELIYHQIKASNGKILKIRNDYAICFKENSKLIIQEISSSKNKLENDILNILLYFNFKKAVVQTKGNKYPYAMIKTVDNNNCFNINDIYINTMLD